MQISMDFGEKMLRFGAKSCNFGGFWRGNQHFSGFSVFFLLTYQLHLDRSLMLVGVDAEF